MVYGNRYYILGGVADDGKYLDVEIWESPNVRQNLENVKGFERSYFGMLAISVGKNFIDYKL